jgi:HSP20 family protein
MPTLSTEQTKEKTPMTMLTRWDPFRDIDRLHRDLDALWGGVLGRGDVPSRDFSPPCDIQEESERFVVTFDVPGLERDAIDVRVENDRLTVRGKREVARDEKRGPFHMTERTSGSFVRAFSLPAGVDADKVTAEYREGVLSVSLPKRAELKPRQIEVKVK